VPLVLDDRRALARWRAAEVIIIEEISMVDAEVLDKLDTIARACRREPHKAFGGVQIIVVGDFHQLEPVPRDVALHAAAAPPPPRPKPKLAFESQAWASCRFIHVVLTKVERQAEGPFLEMLSQLRVGVFDAAPKLLASRFCPLEGDLVGATPHIYTHTLDVEAHNRGQLDLLSTPLISFPALDQL
jgi:ATP-dependent DNA helicase PIF1